MNSVSSCETTSPPTTAMPSGWRSSALAPAPSAIGSAPMSAAMVVIMIGRKRSRQASRIASQRRHARRAAGPSATSIIMIAFFLTMPISIRMPMIAITLRSRPNRLSAPQGADRGRRQAGQDGQRVDEALVQHAEHDVDGHHRRQQQQALVGERVLEHLGRAREGRC